MRGLTASLSAVCAAVMAALAMGSIGGALTPLIAWASLAIGAAAGAVAWRSLPEPDEGRPPLGWIERGMVALFAVVALRAFLWIVYADHGKLKVLLVNNIGDLPMHWNYVQYLANGAAFWPENPHLAGSGIHYPIGVDLFSAPLRLCGADMIRIFVWAGLAGAAAAGIALFLWGRAFAMAGFLFNGGFFGALVFLGARQEIAWKNLFLTLFVTQRGFLYAIPAGMVLLESWRRRVRRTAAGGSGRAARPVPFWIEVLLYSTMPLFHLHTFLFLSFLLGCWLLFSSRQMRGHVLKLGLVSLVPASLLTLRVTDGLHGASAIRWQPGWMQHDWPFLCFWLGNFGIFLPLLAILSAMLCLGLFGLRGKSQPGDFEARHFVWPSALVFVLCCFVLFAPWEWDNTKLMIWAYLAPLPFLWRLLIEPLPVWLRAGLCVLLFFSGFIALFDGLVPPGGGSVIAERRELDSMEKAFEGVPISGRIAAAPAHDHPLMFLGRKVAMAYPGHLLGHGLPYEKPQRLLGTLMRGDRGWENAARELHAGWLLWGPREAGLYGAGPQEWRKQAVPVASGAWGTLFVLKGWDQAVSMQNRAK